MTQQKAYGLMCDKYNEKFVTNGCRDYGDFYAFFVAPEGTKQGERTFVGSRIICVDKNNGQVSQKEVYELSGQRYRLMD